MVIAIDGPAGAGKSTVARALAERLGLTYLDSGAMYRSVALLALREGVDADDPDAVAPLAEGLDLSLEGQRVRLAGEDVTAAIRTAEVSAAASRVSVHPAVRAAMVARQRELVASGGWVAEGRDIGTVVCPEAPLKVFLDRLRGRAGAPPRCRERRGRRARCSAPSGTATSATAAASTAPWRRPTTRSRSIRPASTSRGSSTRIAELARERGLA